MSSGIKFKVDPQEKMKKIKLPGNVWRMVHDKEQNQLYLDVRSDGKNQMVGRIDLSDHSLILKNFKYPAQSELIGAIGDLLYFVKFDDPNDPNEQSFFSLSWDEGKIDDQQGPFMDEENLLLPQVYLKGTDHHATVEKYLKSKLPLACEYLEWDRHIVISYYSAVRESFQRHLLIIKHGITQAELVQDRQMKGFSPGAFFVVKDQLIFIKDRNEVCIYAG